MPIFRLNHAVLYVREVERSVAFYRDVLGFELMAALGAQAAFLAAGGYHHHLGANTWQSLGASPPPEGTARLLHATVVLPEGARDELAGRIETQDTPDGPLVRDTSGNRLLLAAA